MTPHSGAGAPRDRTGKVSCLTISARGVRSWLTLNEQSEAKSLKPSPEPGTRIRIRIPTSNPDQTPSPGPRPSPTSPTGAICRTARRLSPVFRRHSHGGGATVPTGHGGWLLALAPRSSTRVFCGAVPRHRRAAQLGIHIGVAAARLAHGAAIAVGSSTVMSVWRPRHSRGARAAAGAVGLVAFRRIHPAQADAVLLYAHQQGEGVAIRHGNHRPCMRSAVTLAVLS